MIFFCSPSKRLTNIARSLSQTCNAIHFDVFVVVFVVVIVVVAVVVAAVVRVHPIRPSVNSEQLRIE